MKPKRGDFVELFRYRDSHRTELFRVESFISKGKHMKVFMTNGCAFNWHEDLGYGYMSA